MLFETPLQSDLGTVMVGISVPRPHRGRGVGAALWDWAERRAGGEGRSVFQTEVSVPTGHTLGTWPGTRFATARGFVSAHAEDHLVADLPFDAARLDSIEAGLQATDGYRVLAWECRCPDPYVEAWSGLHPAMSMDVPTGELTREAVVHTVERVRTDEDRLGRNWIRLNALAVTDRGEPVGDSCLYLPRTRPEHAHQFDTLVLRACRGRRVGVMLKVANLRQLERLPFSDIAARRWLHTCTAQGNAPMQAVNARLGFRRVGVAHELERAGSSGTGRS